jgi:hypothetical protein
VPGPQNALADNRYKTVFSSYAPHIGDTDALNATPALGGWQYTKNSCQQAFSANNFSVQILINRYLHH